MVGDKPTIELRFEEIVDSAQNDNEAHHAIVRFFRERATFPLYATLMGIAVTVAEIEYDGNPRLGITAVAIRRNRRYRVGFLGLDFPPTSFFSGCQAAYRRWAGWKKPGHPGHEQSTNNEPGDTEKVEGRETVDLVVYAVRARAASCRFAGGDEQEASVHLRSWDLFLLVPGETITLDVRKTWHFGKGLHLSGKLVAHRFDLARLGLTPLKLFYQGEWDPEEFFAEELSNPPDENEQLPDCYVPVIAAGERPWFEMEQVVPGDLVLDADGPILDSIYCRESGDLAAAQDILMDLLQEDLRCLDAYAHMGNIFFDSRPETAIQYYRAGIKIGGLSLPPGFNGVLLWGSVDNRPYLRCLQSNGLCLWRLERFTEAEEVFTHLLWLNPPDNQGARFLIDQVRKKIPWHPDV